jgi:site-specific recombinase XerD
VSNAEALSLPAPIEPRALLRVEALPVERHPAAVYLTSLGSGSRRTMRQSLGVIAGFLSGGRADVRTLKWEALRYQHCQAVRTALAERYAAGTTNKMLAALRGVLKEAWRLGLMNAESYHRAIDLKAIKSETLPRGRALSSGELRALFEACADGTKAGIRDAALLAILYAGGLRRSEAVSLDLADYQPETGALTVRGGKGRKDRIVYALNGSADALADWITLRGSEAGALFCFVNKGDRIVFRRMTDQAVLGIVRKRGEEAGVARFSPHDLRRTFVSDLLDAGTDISTVKRLAGHASEATTGKYDRRGEEAKKKAAQLLHVPYLRASGINTQPSGNA